MNNNFFIKFSLFIFFICLFTLSSLTPCSSFTLKKGDTHIYGRNLDERSDIPGFILVNKRGVLKKSITFQYLLSGKQDNERSFSWKSKYGSITFNNWTSNLPDGGMNEEGLFFEEMTLLKTVLPDNKGQKKMFMNQWIQYILDTCKTVEEVIASAKNISLDGWGWHFFAADKTGKSVVIEFIDGKPVIHTGKDLPYPLLCNSTYSEELKKLKKFEGFGGKKKIAINDAFLPETRFVKGVKLLKKYNSNINKSAVDYGFHILKTITSKKWNKLAKIYDVKNKKIYFHSNQSRKIKYFDFNAFDFTCNTASKVLFDVHADISGNIAKYFINLNEELSLKLCVKGMEDIKNNPDMIAYFKSKGTTIDQLIKNLIKYSKSSKCI